MIGFIDMGAVMLRVLEVKRVFFHESFVTMDECESVRDALSKKLEGVVNWKYCTAYFKNCGEKVYTFDTSLNQSMEVAKEWYLRSNEELLKVLDDELIKAVLVDMLVKKYEQAIGRTCYTCNSECCGGLSNESAANCHRWTSVVPTSSNKMLKKSLGK